MTAEYVVWAKFLQVESRLLCATTSDCELVCTKLGSFMVFVNCMSMEQSDCRGAKFSLARIEFSNKLKLVIGGNPCKNFDSGCCAKKM